MPPAPSLGGDEGPSLGRQLQQVRNELARQAEHEPRLADIDAMLDTAAIQLDEAASLLERVRADLDLDPAAFDELDRKLGRLHDLARKHRVTPDAAGRAARCDRRPNSRRCAAPANACARSTAKSTRRAPRWRTAANDA